MHIQIENSDEKQEIDYMSLMAETLKKIDCLVYQDDDTGSFLIIYKGDTFNIDLWPSYIGIWHLRWGSINVNDLKVPKLRRAINLSNFEFGPTVVLSEPDNDGKMYIHSRHEIVFHPVISDLPKYLEYNLNLFFDTKMNVHKKFRNLLEMDENN